MRNNENLGADVKETFLREMVERGVTKHRLARMMGVESSSVYRMFNSHNWTIETAARVADALGVEVEFKIRGEA